ncbi:5-formyltetrahydrofolate cyclo-ligase [Halobacterium jilantaiense]|uniref:5-formyltetrahydrofolate cyclo-ligase n=1 Tax=Halobacterium jilantaiense TaxID=355548 RepID=A0A1I0QGE3_9EURY|nr:5-formyltetrahydrofolate cyclo-ligase [Halobacterium jilantaiense]SEW26173.1 5-formyltetrahydrofolate cyclo-ligase [Halobacterium jilantaiense]
MDKQALRERVWDDLEASGVARFPFPPHGRIPNFAGASEAADRLTGTEAWRQADTVKANPDAPQLPVRRAALRAGKTLYAAVPRLRDEDCFLRIDPATVDDVDAATTVSGIGEYGEPVGPEAVEPIDLVVSGSVAVTERGERVGKGEGYSDLEFALLRAFDRVDDDTTTVTTVHERQVVDDAVPAGDHDVPMDLVVTPERTVDTEYEGGKPTGIDWNALGEDRIAEIPVLGRLRE